MHAKAALTLLLSMLVTTSTAVAQETNDNSSFTNTLAKGRLRLGFDGVVGLESISAGGVSFSGAMFGVEGRIGWQLNDMFALYAEPHLSFGSLSTSVAGGSFGGGTGTFVGTLMGEATFQDQFFAGAGLGFGVLNNPSGFALEARGGWYPLRWQGENGRRKALMVGASFRTIFAGGGTGILALATVGYEWF